jgi:hypothetical protein
VSTQLRRPASPPATSGCKDDITWDELVAREPRLGALLAEAKAVSSRRNPHFCANEVWYGYAGHRGIKPRLRHLVGWDAMSDDPDLHSCRAWDAAYQTIYDALPSCRACGCMRPGPWI